MRKAGRFAFGLLIAGLLAVAGSLPVAAGYGNSGGNVQLYQVTASFNCNNPSFCGNNLGGFWAWAVFNQDGTFDAELTGCSHLADSHAPGLQGAQHFHADGHYIVAPFNGALWIVVVDEVDTASGGFLGTRTVMPVPREQLSGVLAAIVRNHRGRVGGNGR